MYDAGSRTSFTLPAAKAAGERPSIIITTGDVDRQHDRIIPSGLSFENFLRVGGPVLFGHDYKELPVGMHSTLYPVSNGWRASWDWVQNDERASRVKNAFDQGAIGGASVGINVVESTPNAFGGYDITKSDLVEFSLTPVPANPHCVRVLRSLGLWAAADEPITLPESLTPQRFVALCADAVKQGVREAVDQLVRRSLAHRSGSDPDKQILILDPPVRHVERAHLGHVGPVLRRFKPDEHVLILDEERGRR
jgi:hypothetical protein